MKRIKRVVLGVWILGVAVMAQDNRSGIIKVTVEGVLAGHGEVRMALWGRRISAMPNLSSMLLSWN